MAIDSIFQLLLTVNTMSSLTLSQKQIGLCDCMFWSSSNPLATRHAFVHFCPSMILGETTQHSEMTCCPPFRTSIYTPSCFHKARSFCLASVLFSTSDTLVFWACILCGRLPIVLSKFCSRHNLNFSKSVSKSLHLTEEFSSAFVFQYPLYFLVALPPHIRIVVSWTFLYLLPIGDIYLLQCSYYGILWVACPLKKHYDAHKDH